MGFDKIFYGLKYIVLNGLNTLNYRYSSHFSSNKLFFAMVDFDEGPDVFQVLLDNKKYWTIALTNIKTHTNER